MVVPDNFRILPAWASDGSGVLVGGQLDDTTSGILHPGGIIAELGDQPLTPACKSAYADGAKLSVADGALERRRPSGDVENVRSDSVILACLAPDESAIAVQLDTSAAPEPRSTSAVLGPEGTWFEIDGSFAGWLRPED